MKDYNEKELKNISISIFLASIALGALLVFTATVCPAQCSDPSAKEDGTSNSAILPLP